MFSSDSYLPMIAFLTRFAETYNQGTYGSGGYNEAGSSTDSPADSSAPAASGSANVTTNQVTETPATADDQSVDSADVTPRATSVQPSKQFEPVYESNYAGLDPLWIMIAVGIVIAVLITLFVVAAKKLSRR